MWYYVEEGAAPEGARGALGVYSIHELSAESGYAPRTIHGFIRRGILPRPRGGRGVAAHYTDEHLRLLREYVAVVKDGRVTRADFAERVALRRSGERP